MRLWLVAAAQGKHNIIDCIRCLFVTLLVAFSKVNMLSCISEM